MLEPVGFWSYARHDDAHSDGHLSQLRVIIGKAIGLRFGGEVMLWQDIAAIPFGADWAQTIAHTVGQTTFFVPIVTPRFLKSRHCHEEYLAFRQRMRDLGRNDLVFPIHYVDVDDMTPGDTLFGGDLDGLRGHQWIDYRPLLDVDPRSTEVRIWAGALAKAILQAMRRQPPQAARGQVSGERPRKQSEDGMPGAEQSDFEELIDYEDVPPEEDDAAPDAGVAPGVGGFLRALMQGGPGVLRRFVPPPAGRLFADDQWVGALAIAPDGKTALATYADRTLKLWDLASGQLLREFAGHWLMVDAVAIAPDGKTALSGSTDWRLRHWDIATGQTLRKLKGHRGAVYGVAIAPDGRTALSGGRDKALKLWDLATGRPLRNFVGHADWVHSVAITPDGKTGLSGSRDTTVRQWDLATGSTLRTFVGHAGAVRAVAISPDGSRAISTGDDGTLKLWDLSTGRCLQTGNGHVGKVFCVAVAPDGDTAASGGSDGTVRTWDLATGRELRRFTGHRTVVSAIAYAPDGKTMLSGSHDRTLILWDVC